MPKKRKSKKAAAAVPYARGYKPPTREKSIQAIMGTPQPPDSTASLPRHLQPTKDSFNLVPLPTSRDDWLAQYKEDGQSYREFLRDCPWLSKRRWKRAGHNFVPDGQTIKEKYPNGQIYLLKLDEFDGGHAPLFDADCAPSFDALIRYVEIFYGLPVAVLDGLKIVSMGEGPVLVHTPSLTSASRASPREKRHLLESRRKNRGHTQLRVRSILEKLWMYIPSDAFFLMGLTMYDLYDTPPDLFVAGMAAGNHRVGVFSFFRYDPSIEFSPEFWHVVWRSGEGPEKGQAVALLLQRSCKLLVHEIAHLLGIDHCIFYECCMNGSGHLDEDFRQPMILCPVDLHKLETLCGFDVVERYKLMKGFFEEHGLEEECKWIEKRLDFILKS